MPEPAPVPVERRPLQPPEPTLSGQPALRDEGPASRFDAAEHLLDRLDTRPQELRLRQRRPWWRFW